MNVNIWFFMQKLSLAKRYVNLKYGLGLELNNYRYKSSISYKESGKVPTAAHKPMHRLFSGILFHFQNKLAADYLIGTHDAEF